MSIKILGGLAKGQALFVPPEHITRPTSVMLRRKVFDAVQELDQFHFYDFCAGSGAMGIEAWSRGAMSVTLLEPAPKALAILKRNCQTMGERFSAECAARPLKFGSQKFEQWLKRERVAGESVLFFDPPYKDHALYAVFREFVLTLEISGEVWVESDYMSGVAPEFFASWGDALKCYEHSDSWLARWKLPLQKTA